VDIFEMIEDLRTLERTSGRLAVINALVFEGLNLPDATVFYDMWIREQK
jgi:hypothetical protein